MNAIIRSFTLPLLAIALQPAFAAQLGSPRNRHPVSPAPAPPAPSPRPTACSY